jgi:hypothetical protein
VCVAEALNVRETVAEGLSELIYTIVNCVNRSNYMPKMPVRSELSTVFDTRFDDVQPYAFRTSCAVGLDAASSIGDSGERAHMQPAVRTTGTTLTSTFKRILTDTLLK